MSFEKKEKKKERRTERNREDGKTQKYETINFEYKKRDYKRHVTNGWDLCLRDLVEKMSKRRDSTVLYIFARCVSK